MESKFEILSYQNCNDLKKAINPSSVLIGAVTHHCGIAKVEYLQGAFF